MSKKDVANDGVVRKELHRAHDGVDLQMGATPAVTGFGPVLCDTIH